PTERCQAVQEGENAMTTNTWRIDTNHSTVGFSVRHLVFAKVRGQFRSWSGALKLDADDITRSSVVVDIDAASIDTGVEDRDVHLRSADFFDVERFPKLHFESRSVSRVSEN